MNKAVRSGASVQSEASPKPDEVGPPSVRNGVSPSCCSATAGCPSLRERPASAAYLDRDGTVIQHVHYLTEPGKVEIVPGGVEALKKLHEAGYLLVVVSNQSLVGRGYGTADDVEAVNARMLELLEAGGVRIDCVKYCPHHPDDDCANRKPKPGMLLKAAQELGIDLAKSAMIGDAITDVEAGRNAGCQMNILIDPAGGSEAKRNLADYRPGLGATVVASGLPEAVEMVLDV